MNKLTGDWNMTVNKRDFVEAIGTARRRATLRGTAFHLILRASAPPREQKPGAVTGVNPVTWDASRGAA